MWIKVLVSPLVTQQGSLSITLHRHSDYLGSLQAFINELSEQVQLQQIQVQSCSAPASALANLLLHFLCASNQEAVGALDATQAMQMMRAHGPARLLPLKMIPSGWKYRRKAQLLSAVPFCVLSHIKVHVCCQCCSALCYYDRKI